jgi:uncharacterized protein involved in oxidation of intracellular sulfur
VKLLMILNHAPYGTEHTYNGLRLALKVLEKNEGASVCVFLMGDAAAAGKTGQQTPAGYYNVERMLKGVLTKDGEVLLCGSCMDARGIKEAELVEGCRRSNLDRLTELTVEADKILTF